jgi:two-component system, OmpR family, sensor histidine kinase BaeS
MLANREFKQELQGRNRRAGSAVVLVALLFQLSWTSTLLAVNNEAGSDAEFLARMQQAIADRADEVVIEQALARLAEAEQTGHDQRAALSHFILGELATRREDYPVAVDHLDACLVLGQTEYWRLCTMRMAEVYWRLGSLAETSRLLLGLADLYGAEGDRLQRAQVLNNLGIVHGDLGDEEQAERYFRKALEVFEDLGNLEMEARIRGNLAKMLRDHGRVSEARELNDRVLAIIEQLGGHPNLSQFLHVSGSIWADMDEIELARRDFLQSLELSLAQDLRGEAALTKSELARLLLAEGDLQGGATLLKDALDVARELGLAQYQRDIHQLLRPALSSLGRHAEALDSAEQELALARQMFSDEQARELTRMESLYRLSEAERATRLAEANAELAQAQLIRQRMLTAMLAITALLLLTLLALWIRTQRQRVHFERQALRRELRFKQEFSAMLVHDLRGPLQGIVISAELLEEETEPKQVRRLADGILEACEAMSRLTNDLLDLSRSENKHLELRLESTRVAACIETALENVRPRAEARQIQFRRDFNPARPIEIDAGRLVQVFNNLLDNAIRYSPTGGTVTVTLCRSSDQRHQIVRIINQGPGIADEDLDRIFRPYVRTSKKQDDQSGYGLGLAICRMIVRAHGGEIAAVGQLTGACFEVRLPDTETSHRSDQTDSNPAGR